jgi:hypothetical protein
MNEALHKEKVLTTADIARGGRGIEVESGGTASGPESVHGPTAGDHTAVRTQQSTPLFSNDEAHGLRSRWDSIQTGFVDEPRTSVEEADALVATAMKRLAEIFAEERSRLEGQWDRGDNISTEDLRLTLQRYRSFFTRLLSV